MNDKKLEPTYTSLALSQIPRLLTLLDRNPSSPTYGCFDRRYWLDRVRDFPDALPQMGAYPLAFCYQYNFKNNIFFKQHLVKDWALAAILWLYKIQHKDGSFDEFYPNERGWAGPTAFVLYTTIRTLETLGEDIDKVLVPKIRDMVRKAAFYLAKYREIGTLANHYAIALLALYKAKKWLKDSDLQPYIEDLFNEISQLFFSEGWFLEYDGVDPGYLTATISFLSRLWQEGFKKDEIFSMLTKSIEFASYFIFPDGSYGGCIGSRGTQHFYPYGFELLSSKLQKATKVALFMRNSLKNGKGGITPDIMADRYFVYRLVEYLDTSLVANPCLKEDKEVNLPFQLKGIFEIFKEAGIVVKGTDRYYFVCNFKKGGVFKLVEKMGVHAKSIADAGINTVLKNGTLLTSQWIDKKYSFEIKQDNIFINGRLHKLQKRLFTPFRFILFRLFCLVIGIHPSFAKKAKGIFRKMLILRSPLSQTLFKRTIKLNDNEVEVKDEITLNGKEKPIKVFFGGTFNSRYVPQSRYFEPLDLYSMPISLDREKIKKLYLKRKCKVKRCFHFKEDGKSFTFKVEI